MSPYVFDTTLPYSVYLQCGAAAVNPVVELVPRAGLLLGAPTPPPDWPLPGDAFTPAFHWGHSERLVESDVFNVSLTALKNTAKTTAEMWSMEQFDIARDALRRGLHREAFDYLHRAIDGHDGHEGYALDFRHHFLLGLIHLGGFRHHDPALLDLSLAEQSFVTAGRYAVCDHPKEAARAYFAAGWSSYCQGRIDDALRHTVQALGLQPGLAEVQFQAAKIAMHRREPEAARPFLAKAMSLSPAYAALALRDGDFLPFAPLVLEAIEIERDHLGRRASQAMKDLLRHAGEAGIEEAAAAAETSPTATTPAVTLVAALIGAAKRAFGENSLHGFLRAEMAIGAADRAVAAFRIRISNERKLAEDAIQAAQAEVADATATQIGPYRLNALAVDDLNKARTLLELAGKHFDTATLAGYLEAQATTKRALAALKQALASYCTSALHHATGEFEAIEQEIEKSHRQPGAGGSSVKAFALTGAVVALVPGSFLSLIALPRGDGISWAELGLRILVSVVAFAMVGAVLGSLLAPTLHPDKGPGGHRLEGRRTAVRQIIAELRAYSPKRDNLPS